MRSADTLEKKPFAQQKIQALLRPGAFKASEGPSSPTLANLKTHTQEADGSMTGVWPVLVSPSAGGLFFFFQLGS